MKSTAALRSVFALTALFAAGEARCGAPPARDPVEGFWLGTVEAPQGTSAEIGLEFFRNRSGTLIFRLNFPEMFTYGAAFDFPVKCGPQGHYAITEVFDIQLDLAGNRLQGTLGKGAMPLTLSRASAFPARPAPLSYPPAPAPAWKYPLGSGTWAPPAVYGDIIFIGTDAGLVHAVHASDGSRAWTWRGANPIDSRAVAGANLLYVLDARTNLVALDRASGSQRWIVPLHDASAAGGPVPDNPTFNHRAATPLLLDGVLYCGSSDRGLYALDAQTGKILWRHDAGAPVYSGLGLSGPDTLMFGTMDGSVVLLDRRSRTEILRAHTAGAVVTTPVAAAGRLVVGSRDYMLYGLDPRDGAPLWRYSYWFSWIESTPAFAGGILYVGASDYSRVTALEPASGRPLWSTPVRGMNWGTPLVTANAVFTGTVAQNLPGTLIAHVGGIMALDRATGTPKWQLRSPPPAQGGFGGYAGSLAEADGRVIAAGLDGDLIALPEN